MKNLRPTSSKVLQALFNILYSVKDKSFLDLFAGTGEIGVTALKKGAKDVVFVEIEKKRAEDIKRKLKKFSIQGEVHNLDAIKFLRNTDKKFDIIFADPPYDYKFYDKLIEEAMKKLNKDGIFILEHRVDKDFENYFDKRTYGDTALTFWRKEE